MLRTKIKTAAAVLLVPVLAAMAWSAGGRVLAATQQSGAAGISGTVAAPPPSQGATIEIPKNGQNFSTIPITVSGLCPNNTLVEIYKNNVFGGAANCQNGSLSLQVDLLNG